MKIHTTIATLFRKHVCCIDGLDNTAYTAQVTSGVDNSSGSSLHHLSDDILHTPGLLIIKQSKYIIHIKLFLNLFTTTFTK